MNKWQAFSWILAMAFVAAVAKAQTIAFPDGTVVELLEGERLYISTEPLYELKEAEPVSGLAEPFSVAWCQAWLASEQPLTFESIDTRRRCERVLDEAGE